MKLTIIFHYWLICQSQLTIDRCLHENVLKAMSSNVLIRSVILVYNPKIFDLLSYMTEKLQILTFQKLESWIFALKSTKNYYSLINGE